MWCINADCLFGSDEPQPDGAPPWECPNCGKRTYEVVPAAAPTDSVVVETSVNLWMAWLRVAIDQGRRSGWFRDEAARRPPGDRVRFRTGEFDAALTSVHAAAFALEAFHASLAVSESARAVVKSQYTGKNPSRHTVIRETLQKAFQVDNPTAKAWRCEFMWLFDLRNGGVHYKELLEAPRVKPGGGLSSATHAKYGADSAKRAVEFALGVVRFCAEHPRSDSDSSTGSYLDGITSLESRWTAEVWHPADVGV